MRRRHFTLISALSLALCVAASAMWCRSHWRQDGVYHMHHHSPSDTLYTLRGFGIASTSGRITCLLGRVQIEGPDVPWWVNSPMTKRAPEGWSQVDVFGSDFAQAPDPSIWNKMGFAVKRSQLEVRQHLDMDTLDPDATLTIREETRITIPYWLIVVLTVLLPLNWLRLARRHRHPPCDCPVCGYDLRATPGRCPECGTVQGSVNS